MNRIQSKKQRIGTYEINQISLSCFDDKMYILNNAYSGVTYKKTVILTTIRTSFFLSSYENIIFIFSLVRTAFLSSYQSNILIFPLVRTAFLVYVI